MVELYVIEQRRNYYQVSPLKDDGSWRMEDPVEIDEVKFKELLQTMPSGDKLTHYNQSFRIVKDGNSLRISFFDYKKDSSYIRGKHQLEKKLTLDRYILKVHSNNFYVSSTTFAKRKRRRAITQNFVRYDKVYGMVHQLLRLLYSKSTDDIYEGWVNLNKAVPDLVSQEIRRIQKILINELDIDDTIWESLNTQPFQLPKMTVELSSYLTNFFNNIILIWFAQKNHIKVREPWLYRLMARQYVTKNDLLKYDNDYLSAILHYYRLSDESIAIIKDKINEIVAYNIDLPTISVWEKIFSQRFILDSNILYHRIAINEIFRLQHPQEREKFEEFQKYLDQNRQHIVDLVMDNVKANEQGNYEVNYALNLPKIITDIGRLYRMHIMFDFARLNEMIHDTSFNDVEATMVDTGFGVLRKTDDVNVSDVFHRGIDTLLNESDKFFITKFNPLYKKKIERKFTMFGEKWQLKLDFKNVHTGATTLFEVSAHLANLTTNNTIEIVINNPNFKRDVTMNVEPEDLVKYIYVNGKRRLHIDFDKLGYTKGDEIRKLKGKQLIQAFCKYNAAPMLYRRKKPADDSSFVHVLRKVYEQFYSYTRMFTVDYQVLYPILDYHRKEITILNKYTYIKP